jgi:hypothetical protein
MRFDYVGMFFFFQGSEESRFSVAKDEFYSKKITNKIVQQLQVSLHSKHMQHVFIGTNLSTIIAGNITTEALETLSLC